MLASTFIASLLFSAILPAQSTERISVDSAGVEANAGSGLSSSFSANGRFVAFSSGASNLVPGDLNNHLDVFVRDRTLGLTTRVSVDSLGQERIALSDDPFISASGRFVLFTSWASFDANDLDSLADVYLHDRQTGATILVNRSSIGVAGKGGSFASSISADGRFISFKSFATSLVSGDNNGVEDLFVRDLELGLTTRVNIDSSGVEANGRSGVSRMSADGRMVLFSSAATNLVPSDTNDRWDIFVHDRMTSQTQRVSVSSSGVEGSGNSLGQANISANGRFVTFSSSSKSLVPGDNNNLVDIFTRDLQSGRTERVSVDSSGAESNASSVAGDISSDGRFITFHSTASNLVAGDTNQRDDVFLRDRLTGQTTRVSVDGAGIEGDSESRVSSISLDGRFVSFYSSATNLVAFDTNLAADIFVRDRGLSAENNTILLTGPFLATAGQPLEMNWYAAPAASDYFLLLSRNLTGTVFSGHNFDLGGPVRVVATGTNSLDGEGSFTQGAIPPSAAGFTFYFELAARDGSQQYFDSIVQAVEVH